MGELLKRATFRSAFHVWDENHAKIHMVETECWISHPLTRSQVARYKADFRNLKLYRLWGGKVVIILSCKIFKRGWRMIGNSSSCRTLLLVSLVGWPTLCVRQGRQGPPTDHQLTLLQDLTRIPSPRIHLLPSHRYGHPMVLVVHG